MVRDRCWYCGVEVWMPNDGEPPGDIKTCSTIDHVIPLSRGGSKRLSNSVACCRPCNSSKHNRPLEEYRSMLWLRSAAGKAWSALVAAQETGILTDAEAQVIREAIDRIKSNYPKQRFYGESVVPPAPQDV